MFDRTVDLFDTSDPYHMLYSCLLTGVVGYSTHFILIAFEYFVLKKNLIDKNSKFFIIVELIFFLIAFLSMVAIWRLNLILNLSLHYSRSYFNVFLI